MYMGVSQRERTIRASENSMSGWRCNCPFYEYDIQSRPTKPERSFLAESGVGTHLTPNKRRRKTADGIMMPYTEQKHYNVCKTNRTTLDCFSCSGLDGAQIIIYSSSTCRDCFPRHIETIHELEVFEISDEKQNF